MKHALVQVNLHDTRMRVSFGSLPGQNGNSYYNSNILDLNPNNLYNHSTRQSRVIESTQIKLLYLRCLVMESTGAKDAYIFGIKMGKSSCRIKLIVILSLILA